MIYLIYDNGGKFICTGGSGKSDLYKSMEISQEQETEIGNKLRDGYTITVKNDTVIFTPPPSPTPEDVKKQAIINLQNNYLPLFRENNIIVGASVFEAKEDLSDLPSKLKALREDDQSLYLEYKQKLDKIIKGETVEVSCTRPKRCALCGQYTLIDKGDYWLCTNCGNIEYK